MSLFVDTCVWSLAFRRDIPSVSPHVNRLRSALGARESIYTTGLVLQELLQGFRGPKAYERILERFSILPLVVPDREDHIEAAEIRNTCRRHGIQLATVDALIARLCMRYDLLLLSSDKDFLHAASHLSIRLWQG